MIGDMADPEPFDLVVIGAGIHGLSAARTYLQIEPRISVLILDVAQSIGGVWAEERLYPYLSTNSVKGHYELSDFPMEDPRVLDDSHIPGEVVHDYLHSYAKRYDLIDRIRLRTKVKEVEELESGWLLHVEQIHNTEPLLVAEADLQKSQSRPVLAAKLIVAAGLTSDPFIPDFQGAEDFGSPILHTKNFASDIDKRDRSGRNIVVYGGTKSAFDVIYAYARRDIQVDWIIRDSGRGPCYMAPKRITPLKILAENLITTRLITWLSPCSWGDADGYPWIRRMLNETALGRKIVQLFNYVLAVDICMSNGYQKHPETAKLQPWYSPFWVGTGRGILNFDADFFEYVRSGRVKVHICDVKHLTKGKVHLSSSEIIDTDTIVCCTGWKHAPPIRFTKDGVDISSPLGLPNTMSRTQNEQEVIDSVDGEILKRYPILQNSPSLPKFKSLSPMDDDALVYRPYWLYRFMVSTNYIEPRNIAFAGCIRSPFTPVVAQVQALWIAAFLTGKLDPLKLYQDDKDGTAAEKLTRETFFHARFGVHRYPLGFGDLYPDIFFDSLPYVDLLLADLGLKRWRKRNWWQECVEHYGVPDYRGLVEEWLSVT